MDVGGVAMDIVFSAPKQEHVVALVVGSKPELGTFICNGSTVEKPEGLGDRAVKGCMGRADEPDDGAG